MNAIQARALRPHSRHSRRRGRLLLVGLSLSAALLCGCSITTVDGKDAPPASPETTAAEEPSPETSTAPEDATDPAANADAPALTGQQQEVRDELRASSTTTLACEGELLLGAEQSGQSIVVTGYCESLTVEAEGATVLAESVGTLVVGGSGIVVYVDSADSISVTGSASVVNWASGDPTVSDTGQANLVTKG